MSFQSLHDVKSVASTSSVNQLLRSEPQDSGPRVQKRRKALLTVSVFALIVFVLSILGYGNFSLNTSQFDTAAVSGSGPNSNSDARLSTYAATTLSNTNNDTSPQNTNIQDDQPRKPSPPSPSTNGNGKSAKVDNHPSDGRSIHISTTSARPFCNDHTKIDTAKTPGQVSQEPESTGVSSHEENKRFILSRTKRSRNSNRRGQASQPTLPPNPAAKHAVSLLYEMRLNPKFEYFVCPSNIHKFKTVLTIAVNETRTWAGYGHGKRSSKKVAAQKAATEIYSPNINYTDMPSQQQQEEIENCAVGGWVVHAW